MYMIRKCKTYTCSWLRKVFRTCSISAKSTSYLLAILASLDRKFSSSSRSFVVVVLDNALPYQKWKINDSGLPFNSQFGIQSYGIAELLLNLGFSNSESLLRTFDTIFNPTFWQEIIIKYRTCVKRPSRMRLGYWAPWSCTQDPGFLNRSRLWGQQTISLWSI